MLPVLASDWNEFCGFASLKCDPGASEHTRDLAEVERQWDAKTQGTHPWQQHRGSCMCHHHAAEISCNGSSWWGSRLFYGTLEVSVVDHYLQNTTGNMIVHSEQLYDDANNVLAQIPLAGSAR